MPIEMGTKDISDKWDTFLKELYELGTMLKITGRKTKSKIGLCLSVISLRTNVHENDVFGKV